MDFLITLIVIGICVWSSMILKGNKGTKSNSSAGGGGLSTGSWTKIHGQSSSSSARVESRKKALAQVQPFLKPYRDIMGEHCLTNGNCKINLVIEKDGSKKIICIDKHVKKGKRKILTAVISQENINYYLQPVDYVVDSMWDNLCMNFSEEIVYENVIDALRVGMLYVKEAEINANAGSTIQQGHTQENLLNINTATEKELMELPGVNVILAKKIVRHIQKEGAFKSIDEFIKTMQIKDVFADQIQRVACVSLSVHQKTSVQQNSEVSSEENQAQGDSIDFVLDDDADISSYMPHSDNERTLDL